MNTTAPSSWSSGCGIYPRKTISSLFTPYISLYIHTFYFPQSFSCSLMFSLFSPQFSLKKYNHKEGVHKLTEIASVACLPQSHTQSENSHSFHRHSKRRDVVFLRAFPSQGRLSCTLNPHLLYHWHICNAITNVFPCFFLPHINSLFVTNHMIFHDVQLYRRSWLLMTTSLIFSMK